MKWIFTEWRVWVLMMLVSGLTILLIQFTGLLWLASIGIGLGYLIGTMEQYFDLVSGRNDVLIEAHRASVFICKDYLRH